jgi:uncharacterized protein (TIGR00288 family)
MKNYFSWPAGPSLGGTAAVAPRSTRSAALLIDFDNVTLGVHSDLGRELKNLINSEVFRGKIAVRRAYADWRRFPNYVVPLTEASIDLIFAPAYGSSKKNTTDLRMSADAIELAFTRPEIDTFILLTGDSDFSSTVMKLKEYGKYVIGVGMRESSSDLIIQNCDEYFSYHALTGLTKTSAGEGMREDPWELVVRAVQKMTASGDSMRTDRLKQVMMSLDPGFNEKEIGYSKFSRFVHEAEKKGLIKLTKLADGQYEISMNGQAAVPTAETREAAESRERREPRRDGRRDRRGDRDRGRRREPIVEPSAAETPEAAEVTPLPVEELSPEAVAPETRPAAAEAETAPTELAAEPSLLDHALGLLQRAVQALTGRAGESARDGDVKRRMLEMESGFDESKLGYSKFSRFLRAAHDCQAIDLERFDDGHYEIRLGSRKYHFEAPTARSGARAAAPEAPAAAPARPAAASLRGRTRGRGTKEPAGPPPLLPGQVVRTATADASAPATPTPAEPEATQARTPVEAGAETPAASAPAAEEKAEAAASRRRGRRGGRRGASAAEAPPAPLPGQVVEVPPVAEAAEPAGAVEVAAAAAESAAVEEAPRKRGRGGRGRKRAGEKESAAEAATEQPPVAEPEVQEQAAKPSFSAEALQLPTGRSKIENYLTRSYKGVGKKTVEPLLDAFEADIFRVFAEEPHRVEEVLGEKRAATVLEQWQADFERRRAEHAPPEPVAEPAAEIAPEPETSTEAAAAEPAAEEAAPTATRARRRGGRGRKKKADAKTADTTEAEPAAEEPAAAAAEVEPVPDAEEKPRSQRRSRSRGGRSTNKKESPAS